jgi:hypothetical protein
MFGVVCVICFSGKRIELYRILVVEMNDWGGTDVRGRVAVVGEADNVITVKSSLVSLEYRVGSFVWAYCNEPPGDDASSTMPSILGAWLDRMAAGTSGRHEEGSVNLS